MPLLVPRDSRFVVLAVGASVADFRPVIADTEVVRCPTDESAASALATGRRYSALLLPPTPGGGHQGVVAAAQRAAVPVLSLNSAAAAAELAAELAAVAWPVPRADQPPDLGPAPWPVPPSVGDPGARLVAVCGPGGTGASVVAAALGRNLPPAGGRVLLADLALRADQAFLHGVGEDGPGLLDLVDRARYRPIGRAEIQRHTVALARGRLLRGLRRAHHWTALPPAAFDHVLFRLLATSTLVVADVTGDVEGEAHSGSLDVEERNHLARRTIGAADVVVAVGGPGALGARHLATLIDDLLDLGIDPARIQPVVNRSFSLPPTSVCGLPARPVAIPEATCERLPPRSIAPLAAAVDRLLVNLPAPDRVEAPVPIAPGSLGCRTL